MIENFVFQIAVSFYLLYTQVGIAFVAGVVFTIILIPINKYIASKIGKNTYLIWDHVERESIEVRITQEEETLTEKWRNLRKKDTNKHTED